MQQHTVLVADSSEDFCHDLRDVLRRSCAVHCCYTGMKALKQLHDLRPDVLVLDMMLPELDGVSLLRVLSIADCHPVIIATTCLVTDYLLECAQKLDVAYLMVKPCCVRAVAARVQEQLKKLDSAVRTGVDLQFRITGLLLMLGISVKLKGFHYLEEAVFSMVLCPGQSMTKELYPWVAKTCDAEPSHVERSIRGAVVDAWAHRDERVWQLYFPTNSQGVVSRPTNTVFISRIADGLRLSRAMDSSKKVDFIPAEEALYRES